MAQREGHEGRTDLYEKAKNYWFEHPGMPQRPVGLHATTVSNSPMGALENVRAEVAGAEGTARLQDGHHIMNLMEHDPNTGEVTKAYAVSHNVEDGKTAHSSAGFIPSIQNAHYDNYINKGK